MFKGSFLKSQILFLIFSFCILYFYFPVGGKIDLLLIQPWVDATGHFPHRSDWLLTKINHGLVKNIIIVIYVAIFSLWCASFKVEKLKSHRFSLGYLFWISILAAGIIGFIKSQSPHACPWNMTQPTATGFVWDFSAKKGHCFPGGHAATGFMLMTGYFVYRLRNTKLAYLFLISGIVLGFIMGWGQMMRGAHFFSHNIWTFWIVWCANVVAYLVFSKKLSPFNRPLAPHSQPSKINTYI